LNKKGPKFFLFGAHGGTIAGIQAGIEHRVTDGPMLGAYIKIEVYKKNGDIYVNWKYNNKT